MNTIEKISDKDFGQLRMDIAFSQVRETSSKTKPSLTGALNRLEKIYKKVSKDRMVEEQREVINSIGQSGEMPKVMTDKKLIRNISQQLSNTYARSTR